MKNSVVLEAWDFAGFEDICRAKRSRVRLRMNTKVENITNYVTFYPPIN
jgi:hypothetical protein